MHRNLTRSRSSRFTRRAVGPITASAACRQQTSGVRMVWYKQPRRRPKRQFSERGGHMTVAKTGAEHIASLRDGRTVYIDGQLVPDVTTHPAFRNSVHSAGALYDF